MKTIQLLDSKFEYNQNSSDAILAKTNAIRMTKKFGIEWYENIQYHQEYGYMNFTIVNGDNFADFQVLIKKRELYYRNYDNYDAYNSLPKEALSLIQYIGNQDSKCHKFFTDTALNIFLGMIDRSMKGNNS